MGKRKYIEHPRGYIKQEYYELVTARKNYVCHDSGKPIFKGEQYILDSIQYINRDRFGEVRFKWVKNRICLKSWRLPLP